jgi:SAM-dependent methyltransferase
MERDEKLRWNRKYGEASHASLEPESFLVSAYSEFVAGFPPGDALDLAGGAGRHALWLAQRGWKVKLIDISEAGVELADEKARSLLPVAPGSVTTEVLDLKSVQTLGVDHYELVLVFFYLQRNLFPALIQALKPGGFLIYQTYFSDQQSLPGGPRDPAYLLNPNELREAFRTLQILHYRERSSNRATAELVARKEAKESPESP